MKITALRWVFLALISSGSLAQAHGQTLDSSNLPILIIDTQGQFIPDEPKIVSTIKIIDNGKGKRNKITDAPAYAGKIGIEQRGATSRQFFPKKPYGFELRDTSGLVGVSASILSLPSEEDWVLNATYNDKTLIREVLTYDLYRSFSPLYVPRYKFCEVMLNGKYEGIYILFEKIKRDKNRVDISKLEPKDNAGDALTGGYILKIDKTEGNVSRKWTSPYPSPVSPQFTIPIQVEYPKFDDLTEPQFAYIKKYVTDFENVLKGDNFRDPNQGYAKYIDVDSWVNYFIINEVSRNLDAFRLSTFFYKNKDSRGGKLTMGPIWDYNITYGNANYCNGERTQGWAFDFNRACPADVYQMPFWWDRLLSDVSFADKVRARYRSLRQNQLKTDNIHRYIDSTAIVLQEARVRNFTRWPVIGQNIWPNFYVGATYQDEVAYLKTYTARRLEWMDQEIVTLGVPITATEPEVLSFEFKVFPNPASEKVHISFNLATASVVKLQAYDLRGRVLHETSLGRLAPGAHQVLEMLPESGKGIEFFGLEIDGKRAAVRRVLRE